MARSRARGRGPVRTGGGGDDLAARRAGEALLAQAERVGPRSRWVRVLARVFGVRTADRAWRIGAAGEAKVGRRLERLERAGWRVLHNVPLGAGGDVDHLLIGPAGVFVVNTKHLRKARVGVGREAVFVRGRAYGYPRKSLREAERVAGAFASAGYRVNVAPLIVVHGHRGRIRGWVRRQPLGVQVVPSRWARVWLRLPGRRALDGTAVEALYGLARQVSTWERA